MSPNEMPAVGLIGCVYPRTLNVLSSERMPNDANALRPSAYAERAGLYHPVMSPDVTAHIAFPIAMPRDEYPMRANAPARPAFCAPAGEAPRRETATTMSTMRFIGGR